eukprot:TRINITY_DN1335_c0_g3_i3.p2 TRINITY_DN1335_c0_g3~~TRINITY_DN1335_c0_g3_i3.p2  ORF type:complete len:108 (-),score=13.98 TRINITY_DN1335_c0_g3_i3:19-342(-)
MKSVSFLLLSSWLLLLLLCIEFDGALGSERTKLTSSDRVQDRNKFLSGVQRDLDVLEQDIIRVETKENIGRKKKKWGRSPTVNLSSLSCAYRTWARQALLLCVLCAT